MSGATSKRMRVAGQFVGDALSGRLGLFMMTAAYAVFGIMLLGYVSTQVYTNSLMEGVSAGEADRRQAQEEVGLLMRDYATLVSKERVTDFCESKLGMIEGDAARITRVRLRGENESVQAGGVESDALLRLFRARPEMRNAKHVGVGDQS